MVCTLRQNVFLLNNFSRTQVKSARERSILAVRLAKFGPVSGNQSECRSKMDRISLICVFE